MIRKTDSRLRSGDHVPSFPSLVRREHCFCSQPPAPKLTAGDVWQVIPVSEVPRARLTAEVAQDLDPGSGRLSGAIDHLRRQGLLFLPRTFHKTYNNRCLL